MVLDNNHHSLFEEIKQVDEFGIDEKLTKLFLTS